MEKEIDLYMDGFYTKEINCIDIPLAACCGVKDRNSYFFYIFILFLMKNFMQIEDDWYGLRQKTIEFLGGKIERVEYESQEMQFNEIISAIKSDKIVLAVFKYGSLPYSKYYKEGTYDHGVVICGLDEKKEILKICDRELVRKYIEAGIFTADVLASQWISYDMLKKIVAENYEIFNGKTINMTEHYRKMYSIGNFKSTDWISVKQSLYEVVRDRFYNNINSFINSLRINEYLTISESFLQNNRRDYYLSLKAISKILRQYENSGSVLIEEWEKFLLNRCTLINVIYKTYYSKSSFDALIELLSEDEKRAKNFIDSLGAENDE